MRAKGPRAWGRTSRFVPTLSAHPRPDAAGDQNTRHGSPDLRVRPLRAHPRHTVRGSAHDFQQSGLLHFSLSLPTSSRAGPRSHHPMASPPAWEDGGSTGLQKRTAHHVWFNRARCSSPIDNSRSIDPVIGAHRPVPQNSTPACVREQLHPTLSFLLSRPQAVPQPGQTPGPRNENRRTAPDSKNAPPTTFGLIVRAVSYPSTFVDTSSLHTPPCRQTTGSADCNRPARPLFPPAPQNWVITPQFLERVVGLRHPADRKRLSLHPP